MRLIEREIDIPQSRDYSSLIAYFERSIMDHLPSDETPVRFVVTESSDSAYHCELGALGEKEDFSVLEPQSIFNFMPRKFENTERFNAVLLVPTGIGAEIGGQVGDAGPVANLLASACDRLITHPNVVNACDINEMPANGLYVEGSVICQFLMGTIGLQEVRANRVMIVVDKHPDEKISDLTINTVSAARAAWGLDCPLVVEMDPPIRMQSEYSRSGRAVGRVESLERLCEVLYRHRSEYDAVALASVIDVPEGFHLEYLQSRGEMVNPWGGVEAMLTHAITLLFDVPAAHAPMVESLDVANIYPGVVDPRIAPEAVSTVFLHSLLKGLHRSPRIIRDQSAFGHPRILSAADASCLVIPDGCVGLPTLAALEQGIPVIAVRENRNLMRNDLQKLPFASDKLFIVDNYLEAVGVMAALKAGVTVSSVRRPLQDTRVSSETVRHIGRDEETPTEVHEDPLIVE
jgi:hypothetical protein